MFSATAGVCCQQLRQCRGLRPGRSASVCGLKFQDTLTQRLQGADVVFDAGKGLRQVLFQECIDRLVGTLKVSCDEGPKLFEGQAQRAQALDHLHTPERVFAKQAVVALATALGGEKPEVLVLAQNFDRHAGARESCPMVIVCDRNIYLYLSSLTEGPSLVRIVAAFGQTI